jgi:NTP pyrophosphatase (non-canonical NTP hydrolase)
MNLKKWRECKSANKLLVKLVEEVGEVAKEKNEVAEASTSESREQAMQRMITELQHVRFIAECLSDLVKEARDEGLGL